MYIQTSWASYVSLYLDVNSGGTVPVDLVIGVIPQVKIRHNGSWALRASVKRCCSSIKSWTSFLSRLFSCSRHSYASCNSSARCVCLLRLLCAATRFFSLLFTLLSSSSELSLCRYNRRAGASLREKLLDALKSDMMIKTCQNFR